MNCRCFTPETSFIVLTSQLCRIYDRAVLEVREAEVRECAQCGNQFTPGREHARFCSARCRMAWNDEHAGVAAAPAAAIDWSVAAMSEAARRLASPDSRDLHRLADAIADAVWWVTLVDATLVRTARRNYESTLAGRSARRRETGRPSKDCGTSATSSASPRAPPA